MAMYGILSGLVGYPWLLLGIVRQATKMNICRTVGPSLGASLELLAHRQNVASPSYFYRYYFGRFSSELS